MKSSLRTLLTTALLTLVLGFALGFFPEHAKVTQQQQQTAALTSGKEEAQIRFALEHNKLELSEFAVQAGKAFVEVENNNFSVASVDASALFTALRTYVDQTQDQQVKQQFVEILNNRDRTIAALAQADPAVKPLSQNIFMKLESVQAQALQGKG